MFTQVAATGRNGPVPNRSFSLAGPMIRLPRNIIASNWTAGGENVSSASI